MTIRTKRSLAVVVAMLTIGSLGGQSAYAQDLTVSSPDGTVQVSFILEGGEPSWRVRRLHRDVIRPSKLGFVLGDGIRLDRDMVVLSSEQSGFDETWTQPWGEKKDIRNRYNQLRVLLADKSKKPRQMAVVFRVFDDGVGLRYEWPEQKHLGEFKIMDESTEFVLAADHTAWWIPAYQGNRYEFLYTESSTSKVDRVHTPFTMETANGLFLSIHEAALTDFASMTLANKGDLVFKADLVPWFDGVKVKASTPCVSPWRTLQIGDTAGELITSYLILNLNEPNKLGDVSWVKPGKYVGIWWEMHLRTHTWGSGPQHAATTERTRRYIDFAAAHGFDGVLVEGWNVGWDGNWMDGGKEMVFTQPYPDFDIKELTSYGASKGVSLIGHHETGGGALNYERQMEEAFQFYQDLGVTAVKTGYVAHGQGIEWVEQDGSVRKEWHHGQFMVRHYRKALLAAARHKIMLDVHEPIKPTGIRRTYPNMMTREGARGQEYNAWGANHGNPPDHTTILPFTRLLAGPMDYTPGIFDLLFPKERPDNRVNGTLANQLALYVVLYSPLHMAADLLKNYEASLDAFQFIKDVPTDWSDTRVPHARIGDYVTIVRQDRNSENWYLGAITDEVGHTLNVTLSFLDPGRKYVAEIYKDAVDACWKENPLAIEITTAQVDSTTTLELRLAPGGGQAIRFSPVVTAKTASDP